MQIKLKKLSKKKFNRFLSLVIDDYVTTLVVHKTFDAFDDAQSSIKTHISFLLPNGIKSINHTIFELISCQKSMPKKHIGYLWIEASKNSNDLHYAWINFIYIEPNQRRKSYASYALEALENKLHQQKISSIGLTVFSSNKAAHKLYCSLGYAETESFIDPAGSHIYWNMTKKLQKNVTE